VVPIFVTVRIARGHARVNDNAQFNDLRPEKLDHMIVVAPPVLYLRERFEGAEAPAGTGNPRRESKVVPASWQTRM
jgi:hypothetical protein